MSKGYFLGVLNVVLCLLVITAWVFVGKMYTYEAGPGLTATASVLAGGLTATFCFTLFSAISFVENG